MGSSGAVSVNLRRDASRQRNRKKPWSRFKVFPRPIKWSQRFEVRSIKPKELQHWMMKSFLFFLFASENTHKMTCFSPKTDPKEPQKRHIRKIHVLYFRGKLSVLISFVDHESFHELIIHAFLAHATFLLNHLRHTLPLQDLWYGRTVCSEECHLCAPRRNK